jgi:hypothetical protein
MLINKEHIEGCTSTNTNKGRAKTYVKDGDECDGKKFWYAVWGVYDGCVFEAVDQKDEHDAWREHFP